MFCQGTEDECIDGDEEIEWKKGPKPCSWLLEGKNIVNCAHNEEFLRVCPKTCGGCGLDNDVDDNTSVNKKDDETNKGNVNKDTGTNTTGHDANDKKDDEIKKW